MLGWIARNWERASFVLAMAVILLGVGFLAGRSGWWPTPVVEAAAAAADDLRKDWRHYTGYRSRYLTPTERSVGGVTIHDPALAFEGYTFATLWRDGAFRAELIDMNGTTVHSWQYRMDEVFPEKPDYMDALGSDWDANIQGSYLFPDGDVLLNVYGGGTVRLDRCSNIEWVLERDAHHSIDVLPDGSMLVPVRAPRRTEPSDGTPRVAPGPTGYYEDETVQHIAPDGTVLGEINLLEAIHDSGLEGLLTAGAGPERVATVEDPLHHNDAEMLRPEMADAFPLFGAGDIMVSLRNINTIAVLDATTSRIKWLLTGYFDGQHDPDFLPNGNILVYDNRIIPGGRRSGSSRVLEINPNTQEVVWLYDGGESNQFYANSRGMADRLPNDNILTVDPHGGRIFEIARSAGDKVVWEYVNLAEPHWAAQVIDARRLPPDEVRFLDQPCSTVSSLRRNTTKA